MTPLYTRGHRRITGRQHDARQSILETVATLSGFTIRIVLPHGNVPDVARICMSNGALFIGDAKQSESPRDQQAMGRFENYMRWVWQRRHSAQPHLFCICHPLHHRTNWLPALESIAQAVGLEMRAGGTVAVAYYAAVTWSACFGVTAPPLRAGHSDAIWHLSHLGD